MDKKLEKKLIDEFPTYFKDMYGDPKETCMAWGCEHGDGWFGILYNLCQSIRHVGPEEFHFRQIKEKFGILTIYYSCIGSAAEIRNLIDNAEKESAHVCERCGSKKDVSTEEDCGWVSTFCNACWEQKKGARMRHTDAKNIKRVEKGWGYELWIANKEEYCGKLLYVNKDKKCSYHYHNVKDETFFLHSGMIKLLVGATDDIRMAETIFLNPGDSYYLPPGTRHQFIALKESNIYEFSTQHFDEDSIRVIKGD